MDIEGDYDDLIEAKEALRKAETEKKVFLLNQRFAPKNKNIVKNV